MPGVLEEAPVDAGGPSLDFTVLTQRVDLDVDFASQRITGKTEITVQPQHKGLRTIRLNCRQCHIRKATVEGRSVTPSYDDPYSKLNLRGGKTSVYQHELLRSRIEKSIKEIPEPELVIPLPSRISIQELQIDPFSGIPKNLTSNRQDSDAPALDTPTLQQALESGPKYTPLKVVVEFEVSNFRDGVHWVGFGEDDGRYPHLYTKNSPIPGAACSIFPCVDDSTTRCLWEISIRCPRTLGDAFRKNDPAIRQNGEAASGNAVNGTAPSGVDDGLERRDSPFADLLGLNEEEKTLDIAVICSGDLTDDIVDPQDPTRKTVSFSCSIPVTARHIGFVIGPFEHVDLSEYREVGEDDKLGQTAIKVDGFCLPGRADELRNTCLPMAKAIDYFTVTYGSFPFPRYMMCFVDDLIQDVADTASLSICSNRLLFPDDIIEPLDTNTRILVHALASQYVGVNIIPKEATDMWIITGISYFLTDMFMKNLAGNNEYRYRQKLASERVFELDVDRFSIHTLGSQLELDPSEYDFLALKSALVLFILDRRLTKASGSSGMSRIVTKVLLNAKTGDIDNGEITTDYFHRLCERLGHTKLDSFFKQWIYGAGCPVFMVSQRFNKKKLVVEMTIKQEQVRLKRNAKLEPSTFMREVKENHSEAYAAEMPAVFTGPMTIRIHEADGTPYEHIIEIKEAVTKFEIPYNTKYKRLKRSKRAKERALASSGIEAGGETQDDVLLYCLGDVLQSEEDVKEWRLTDWSKEEDEAMGTESYEWIRMDADFEWIGKIRLQMPDYMYTSQLQQDRDVVAQYESIQVLSQLVPKKMYSTILIRTLMDRRYFHGIRTLAAAGLVLQAREDQDWIGQFHLEKAFQELFCFPDSPMPRANDFSDRTNYLIQCAIPKAMARIRDSEGKVPMAIKRWFVDKLKFNDNSNNELSDCHYVATLMSCLTESISVVVEKPKQNYNFNFDDEDDEMDVDNNNNNNNNEDEAFQKEAINEIERYRRIDEWISSYQNIYTVTALSCMQKLIQAGVLKNKTADILQYTRSGNAPDVRLRAFHSLVMLKVTKKPKILRYLLHNLYDDASPYFRERLMRIFGQALGIIALEQDESKREPTPPPATVDGGLVLEGESAPEMTQAAIDRMTPDGAVIALGNELRENEVFKAALWDAIQCPRLTLTEVVAFLDIAALLYEPDNRVITTLKLPRYMRAENLGKGKLKFTPLPKYRTKPVTGLSIEMWELLQTYELRYNGPPPKEIVERRKREEREAKKQEEVLRLQQELERRQQMAMQQKPAQPLPMSAPPVPAPPAVPKPKISLKRKSTTDDAANAGRAGSPKAQKLTASSTAATPTGTPAPASAAPSAAPAPPRVHASPSAGKKRSADPSPAGPPKKTKREKSLMVKLKLGSSQSLSRFKTIVSKSPAPSMPQNHTKTQPSAPAAASASPAGPAPATDFFATAGAKPNYNVGGFRAFGGAAASPAPAHIKTEPGAFAPRVSSPAPLSAVSPMTTVPPSTARHSSGGVTMVKGKGSDEERRRAEAKAKKREREKEGKAGGGGSAGGVVKTERASTPAAADGGEQKPKKKFTIKLGAKKSSQPPPSA